MQTNFIFFAAAAILACKSVWSETAYQGSRPHIVFVLVDDWGWANVGYHAPDDELTRRATPNIDDLVENGLELDQHYTFPVCAPTRASFLSGRNPANVSIVRGDVRSYNWSNPEAGGPGVPPAMTTISDKLHSAGYKTHVIGKWDAGCSSALQIPEARGFDTSLVFFDHQNDMYNLTQGFCPEYGDIVDFWEGGSGPARAYPNTAYEEEIFKIKLIDIVNNHDPEEPLFLYYPARALHTPLQVPPYYLELFSDEDTESRRKYLAMTKYLDEVVGSLVTALRNKNMWDNTLFVMASDNGGPIYPFGGANNYPLKGGKISNWQGGVRVNAFASGGALPESRIGGKLEEYIHICDWYATFCFLAGVDPFDESAAAAGLPPVDSLNMWPLIVGHLKVPPRNEIFLPPGLKENEFVDGYGLIQGNYKILIGDQQYAMWTGPDSPNGTIHGYPRHDCGETGCLYNIIDDPNEHNDLASDPNHEGRLDEMRAKALGYFENMYIPNRGADTPSIACFLATNPNVYDGFWGPYVDLTSNKGKVAQIDRLEEDNAIEMIGDV